MTKKTISISEARKNLFQIAEEVQKPNAYYVFTVDRVPQVVLMSYKEFRTILGAKLKSISWEQFKKEIGPDDDLESGLVVRDRAKIEYEPYKRRKRGKKKK